FGFRPGQFGSLALQCSNADSGRRIGVPPAALHYVLDVNWVVLLGQVGALGVLAFAAMLLSLFRIGVRRYNDVTRDPLIRGVALGYVGVVIAFFVFGFFGISFELRQVSFYVWLFGGLLAGLPTASYTAAATAAA